jgi:DNA-binding NarL/FixJ family response regulator
VAEATTFAANGTDAAQGQLPPAIARAGLTSRELDVLHLLVEGCTDREIADRLFISRRTASKHVEAILAKLGVHSRGAAAAEMRRLGLATAAPNAQAI